MIKDWSHYPDSFEKFEKDREIISEESLSILEKYKIETKYALHSEMCKYVNFILLTNAFKNKNEKEMGLWISSICHTISDEEALNHGPLIHYITYGISPLKIKMGKGIGLDIIEISKIEGKELILKRLENYKGEIISENFEETIINLLLKSLIANSFMTKRERTIMKSYKINRDERDYQNAKTAMVEIGEKNVKDTLDIVVTPYHYSKRSIEIKFDENLFNKFKAAEKEYIEKRPIEDDSIYEEVLERNENALVGIIIEPSQTMNRSIFPFGSKYILSSIMHYLRERDIPYKFFDIRDIMNKRIKLSSEKIKLLIFSCGNDLPSELKNALIEYMNNNGKILLIAGMTKIGPYKEIFGNCFKYFKEMGEDIIPVSPMYGYDNIDVFKKLKFYFLEDLRNIFGENEYSMIRNPNTPAGWQKPICTIYIDGESPEVKKLIKLTNGEKEVFVGGILHNKIIFIPEYFFLTIYFFRRGFSIRPINTIS